MQIPIAPSVSPSLILQGFCLVSVLRISDRLKMAASEEGNSRDIHSKYEIKRTSYKEKDLETLKLLLEVRFLLSMQESNYCKPSIPRRKEKIPVGYTVIILGPA